MHVLDSKNKFDLQGMLGMSPPKNKLRTGVPRGAPVEKFRPPGPGVISCPEK